MEKWKCTVCGYIHEGPMTPDFKCPICKQGADKFVKIEEAPEAPAKKQESAADRKPRFFICRHCGNLIGMIHNAGVPVVCCGQKMEALIPNTVDASKEKHMPVVTVKEGIVIVNVGSVDHPMIPEHYIEWVYVQTENGGQRKSLKPGDAPNVSFCLGDEKAVAVYAYCNLHGLWMTEV